MELNFSEDVEFAASSWKAFLSNISEGLPTTELEKSNNNLETC